MAIASALCWLFSCNNWALQARCPRYTQSVTNLIVASSWTSMLWLVDSCQKGYLLTSVT